MIHFLQHAGMLFLVVLCASRVTSYAQSETLIVPGKSIGPLEIGMNEDEVRSAVPRQWREGSHQDFEVGDGKRIGVIYGGADRRVVWIQTTSRRFTTEQGARVGDTVRELEIAFQGRNLKQRMPPPFVGNFYEVPGIRFFVNAGVIQSITVCFGQCD